MHYTKQTKTTKQTIEKGVLIPSDLQTNAIPYLLSAYKYGLFVVRNAYHLEKWDELVKAGYIEYVKSLDSKNLLVSLQEKGAAFVRRYALSILENYSPFYTYPLIKSGDKIDVTANTLGFGESGSATLVDFQKGIHIIHSIDRSSMFMSHENYSYSPIRITMKPSKDHLKFVTKISYTQKEFNKRFGKIVIRTILDKAENLFNGLLIADQLNKLYKKSYAKYRIKKT